ncbi:hypothetical protein NQ318_007682, partial [Aromia moschata]
MKEKAQVCENKALALLLTIREQNNQILAWIREQNKNKGYNVTMLPDDLDVQLPLKTNDELERFGIYFSDKNNSTALSFSPSLKCYNHISGAFK